jgi:peptidyl-prolyl cis-trans isomerase B (cyclophilin B)
MGQNGYQKVFSRMEAWAMLRFSSSSMALILGSVLTLTALGCGSSESESSSVTASIDANKAESPSENKAPNTVEVSTGSIYQNTSDSTAQAPRQQVVEQKPIMLIKTSLGDIKVELDSENAPMTVENFTAYVEDGFYNETVFHYVEQGYMMSAGGFKENGESEPTRAYVLNEAHNGLKNLRGTIAMARDPQYKHRAAAQFFINLADNDSLDHKSDETDETYGYCVFGKVIEGMDVVEKIASVEVKTDDLFVKRPAESVVIESIERIR